MTDRMAEIKARCAAATPEPWRVVGKDSWRMEGFPQVEMNTPDGKYFPVHNDADADFIANAREDIPYLLDLLAERDEECNDLRREVISIAQQSFERMRELARLEAEVVRLREAYRWIPVTEGLPEPNTEALVQTDAGSIRQGYIGHATGHWCSGGFVMVPTVTHWMPLPEPPEEGAEK